MTDISVIVPAYIRNDADIRMLDECINSIPEAYEVVVCDDGSPVKYTLNTSRVVWIKSEHHGKSSARNIAVMHAQGPLIFPLDADDMLVPNALETLGSLWQGIPLYPDIIRLHTATTQEEEYRLLDFDCDLITRKCVSSVNVLHSKAQWQQIGGWDETIEFYEDWEYNARLMSMFCGKHISKALVIYRMHPMQSVVQHKQHESQAASVIRAILRQKGVGNMGCCGKRRKTSSNDNRASSNTVATSSVVGGVGRMRSVGHTSVVLPDVTEEGKTLARYVGGQGQGKHYYRGPHTKYPYKVMHNQIMIVDDRDAVDYGQPGSLFVRIQQPAKAPTKPAERVVNVEEEEEEPAAERKPRQVPSKRAVSIDNIPISNMTVSEIITVAKSLTPEEATKLIYEERNGKNRVGAIKVLEKVAVK